MRRVKRYMSAAICLGIAVGIWNFPASYRIGIDGVLHKKTIPLYAKIGGYLYRDWAYRDIVRQVVPPGSGQAAKAEALFRWVRGRVHAGVPAGFVVEDDHPLNIIIRQYGAADQLDDIFTILCAYAGMRAGTGKLFNRDRSRSILLSLVEIDGRWCFFDVSRGFYARTATGAIGSIDEYARGEIVLTDADRAFYGPYLAGLKNIDTASFTRADEQMPLRRVGVSIMNFIRLHLHCKQGAGT